MTDREPRTLRAGEGTIDDAHARLDKLRHRMTRQLLLKPPGQRTAPDLRKLLRYVSAYGAAFEKTKTLEATIDQRDAGSQAAEITTDFDFDAARREVIERLSRRSDGGGD